MARRNLFAFVGFALLVACIGCETDDQSTGVPTTPTPTGPPQHDNYGGTRYDGWTPSPAGFSNRLFVTGPGSVGDTGSVELCVWDYARIDGDLINFWFAGRKLTYSNGNDEIRLQGSETCWTRTVTTGYYYEIRVRALNAGDIPPNTGAVRASTRYGSSQRQQWEVPQWTNGTTSLVVQV